MKRPIALLFCLLMITMPMAGCFGGDDESPETSEPNTSLDDWEVYYVASGSDLPNCNSDTLGRLYYIESDAGFQTCTSTGWSFIDLTGSAGADGIDGTDGADGGDGVPGADGSDGADGADGAPGADGSDGADGDNGSNGHTALAVTSSELSGLNCSDGGIKIEVGIDDNDDGALQSSEIEQTTYVCNGADGINGVNGTKGADGADGINGMNGTNGADGTDGSASPNTMLTSIFPPSASLECTAGGRVMQQGLDNGDGNGTAQNGVLESDEVDYTTTYCSKYVLWQVTDINIDSSSQPGYWSMEILVGDTLYFGASSEADGRELWAYDTSNQSTYQIADINSGSTGSYPGQYLHILVGDTIYFDAYVTHDGQELWAHDTSNHSTWQVANIHTGGGSQGSMPGYNSMSMLVGDTIYFGADSVDYGTELWAHDTSNHTTWQVADINIDSGDSKPGLYMEILVDNTLYFSANDGIDGHELWAHSTYNHTTWQVADINIISGDSRPGISMEILVDDTLYFSANDGFDGHELWAHNTLNHSTWLVADINGGNAGWSTDSYPGSYMEILVGDTLYFSADSGSAAPGTGSELWAHDTSNNSTWQVTDIDNGTGDSYPGVMMHILLDDTLYFDATDGNTGTELWAHDTSNHSTWQVADINIDTSASSQPGANGMEVLLGDTIYFSADDGNTGTELWAHDTSNHSTWLVADIHEGCGIFGCMDSSPGERMHILVDDTLYFDAGNSFGEELWAMTIEHSITYD